MATALGGVSLLATATVAVTAGSASAAEGGKIRICSEGSYSTTVEFPERGRWSSYIVAPGNCYDWNVGGSGSESVDVYGWHQDANQFYIGSATYDPGTGLEIVTTGSSTAPAGYLR